MLYFHKEIGLMVWQHPLALWIQKKIVSISQSGAWLSSIRKVRQFVLTTAVMIPNATTGRRGSTATAASIRISESPARGKKKCKCERSVKPRQNLQYFPPVMECSSVSSRAGAPCLLAVFRLKGRRLLLKTAPAPVAMFLLTSAGIWLATPFVKGQLDPAVPGKICVRLNSPGSRWEYRHQWVQPFYASAYKKKNKKKTIALYVCFCCLRTDLSLGGSGFKLFQAKSLNPLAWKKNNKSLCVIVI